LPDLLGFALKKKLSHLQALAGSDCWFDAHDSPFHTSPHVLYFIVVIIPTRRSQNPTVHMCYHTISFMQWPKASILVALIGLQLGTDCLNSNVCSMSWLACPGLFSKRFSWYWLDSSFESQEVVHLWKCWSKRSNLQ
jgi:hypothetical protein